ncbi:MAG: response regulator, partial [Gammaproteobacteria bacterium]
MDKTWPQLLLIDDDPVAARLLRAVFAPESIGVSAAQTAADGLEQLAQVEPQVVVLDLWLPDMGGLEVLEKLRAQRPQLPVIMLTGQVDV